MVVTMIGTTWLIKSIWVNISPENSEILVSKNSGSKPSVDRAVFISKNNSFKKTKITKKDPDPEFLDPELYSRRTPSP